MIHPSPQKCTTCGKAAKVFANFVAGGKVTSKAWCETHARAEGVDDAHGYALTESGGSPAGRRGESTLRCAGCDCSQRDFERQGRLGCPVCYTTFAGLLPTLLHRMHRDVEHRGKIPARGADPATVRHRLALLQTDLRKAMRAEEQEGAAQTRDAIEALKAKLLAADLPIPGETQPPLS